MFTAYERMYYVLMTSLVERAFTVTLAIVLVLMGFGLKRWFWSSSAEACSTLYYPTWFAAGS